MTLKRTAAVFCLFAAVLLAAGSAHALSYAGAENRIAYIPVHEMGYDGSGVIVGIIDIGVPYAPHPTFHVSDDCTTSRVTRQDDYGNPAETAHPTNVAGIMAGRGPGDGTYLGVAPSAEVWAAGTDGNANHVAQAYLDYTIPDVHGDKCEIFVMSLGNAVDDNGESEFVKFLDWVSRSRGAFIAVPSGNNGSMVWRPGGNYNLLTVGGCTQDLGAVAPNSGRGPTIDGRCKPDVVAPMSQMYVPTLPPDTWVHSPGAFTSFSAPFGAGVAALLKQYSQEQGLAWDARVTKSVIMNSATKLVGWTHDDNQPLDVAQGAGRINAQWAHHQYAADEQSYGTVDERGWDLASAVAAATRDYHITDVAREDFFISATLNWDRHTDYVGGEWVTTEFDDLNLYLYRDSDCALVAQSVSTVDSVEHIFYRCEEEDTYTLSVEILAGGSASETYALSWLTLVPGDANGDGLVDGVDLAIWQENYDPLAFNLNTFTQGDWDLDGDIDGADLAYWQENYNPLGSGGLTAPELIAGLSAVPEPTTLALLAAGLAAGAGVRRRKLGRPRRTRGGP